MYKSVSHNKELIRKTTSLIGWRDIIKEDLKYQGKMKSYSLAYNRRDTRDKRPLGRDPDRS